METKPVEPTVPSNAAPPVPPQPPQHRGVVGLQNFGATCYANAAVQALRQVTEMTAVCLYKDPSGMTVHSNLSGALYTAYCSLLKLMWTSSSPAFIQQGDFHQNMLRAATAAGYSQFTNRQAQDSHEFLMFLLDQFLEGTKESVNFRIVRPPPVTETDRRIQSALEAWKLHFEKQHSPVVDIWFGLYEYTTECQVCKTKNYRYDPFNSFKIQFPPTPAGTPQTLHEFLRVDWQPETIEGYQCDTCHAHVTAIRTQKIWKMPQCLILVFKRFQPNGHKRNDPWQMPTETVSFTEFFSEVSPEQSRNFQFHIQSIIDHHGSANGGHYVAQGLNPLDNHWYLYDDTNSAELATPMIGSQNYILLLRAMGQG